jgi:hypothetical protein
VFSEIAGTNDVLIVPRTGLYLAREHQEIENYHLVAIGRKVGRQFFLLSAKQSIKFDMNEKGMELLS